MVGAQVGYRDLAGFGRRFIDIDPRELTDDVIYQIGALDGLAAAAGTPRALRQAARRALQHRASTDEGQARRWSTRSWRTTPRCRSSGCPARALLRARRAGRPAAVAGGFADRGYTAEGTLVPRSRAGRAAHRRREVGRAGGPDGDRGIGGGRRRQLVAVEAESLCVHGDTPGAVAMARRGAGRAGAGRRDGAGRSRERAAVRRPRRCSSSWVAPAPGRGVDRRGAAGPGSRGSSDLVPAADVARSSSAGEPPTVAAVRRAAVPGAAEVSAVRRRSRRGRRGARDPGALRRPGPRRRRPADRAEPSGRWSSAHTGHAWRVAFGGFAPGFGYLVGGDPRLEVPRRDRRAPGCRPGSVALAGDVQRGLPPRVARRLAAIGRTDAVLWDLDRDPPALLVPGARCGSGQVSRSLRVLDDRAADHGRRTWAGPGSPRIGVGRSGAADRASPGWPTGWSATPRAPPRWRRPLGGLRPAWPADTWLVAVTGAPAPVDGRRPRRSRRTLPARAGRGAGAGRRRRRGLRTLPRRARRDRRAGGARLAQHRHCRVSARRRWRRATVLPVGDLRRRGYPRRRRAGRRAAGRAGAPACCRARARDWFDPGAWTALTTQPVDGRRGQQPGRAAAGRAAAGARAPGRRAAQRGAGRAGAVQVPPDGAAGAVPGRPPGDRRLPGGRRRRRRRRRPRRPGPGPVSRCGSAGSARRLDQLDEHAAGVLGVHEVDPAAGGAAPRARRTAAAGRARAAPRRPARRR